MATVTSLGAGSGLDLEGLVTSLMQVEKRPLTALQTQSKAVNTKISALGALSSKLSSLQSAAKDLMPSVLQSALQKFASYTTTVADSTIASATASTGAVAGSYSLEISKLAQPQRLLSKAFADGTTFTPGTLTIEFGSGSPFVPDAAKTATITISNSNGTLAGVRDAINSANIGISATIVNGTAGAQLILTGQEGSKQSFKLSGITDLAFNPDNVAASDFSKTLSAQDAEFSLNGVPAKSSSNTVTGVLDGVTLKLTKTNVGSPTTVAVTQDNTTNLKTALEAFVKAYNDAASTMKSQGAYDPTTKVAGPLQGNSLLRTAQAELRSLVFNTTAGGASAYQRLSDIGLSVDASGNMALSTSKLEAALAKDADGVANLVAKVGSAFNDSTESIIGISGRIKIATDSMNTMVRDIGKQQDAVQRRLDSIEARYRKQFSSLDTMMSSMNKMSSYLAQQLSTLPK